MFPHPPFAVNFSGHRLQCTRLDIDSSLHLPTCVVLFVKNLETPQQKSKFLAQLRRLGFPPTSPTPSSKWPGPPTIPALSILELDVSQTLEEAGVKLAVAEADSATLQRELDDKNAALSDAERRSQTMKAQLEQDSSAIAELKAQVVKLSQVPAVRFTHT